MSSCKFSSSRKKKKKVCTGPRIAFLKRPFKNRDQYLTRDETSRTQFSVLLYCWHSAHCWWMTLTYTVLVTQAHAVPKAITRGDKIHIAYSLKPNSNLCNHIIKIGPILLLYLSITEQHAILWFYEIAIAIWFHKDYNYKPIVPVARDPL